MTKPGITQNATRQHQEKSQLQKNHQEKAQDTRASLKAKNKLRPKAT